MTGYTVHTGSNDKFRDGWDSIFSNAKPSKAKKPKAKAAKKSNKSVKSKKKSDK